MSDTQKDISIIIPVYNAENLLPRCFDSIVNQTVDMCCMEVIVIDDGSTDSSAQICDEYATRYPDLFTVIHQENTGSPAKPRNRGIREATGTYVFFCDNDDYFGAEAVERMVKHAQEWNSDVLLARMGKTNRIGVPSAMFKKNVPNADLYTSGAFWTLGPWKLYRKSLLIDNSIFFPEDCSLDDSVFTTTAYLNARVISIASDYDYYFWTKRANSLSSAGAPEGSGWRNVKSRLLATQRMLSIIDDKADSKKKVRLHQKIIGESAFNTLTLISRETAEEGEENLFAARELLNPYLTTDFMNRMSFEKKMMFHCLQNAPSHSCFESAKQQSSRGAIAFNEVDGIFQCAYSEDHGFSCRACDQDVRKEINRINLLHEKDEKELSEKEAKELAWLKKTAVKQKFFSNTVGKTVLKAMRLPFVKKIKQSLIRLIVR